MAARKATPSPVNMALGSYEAHADMSLRLPTSAAEVAKLQKEAETDRELLLSVTVTDAEEYEIADSLLTGVVRAKDAAKAMQQSATLPLYGVIKTVEGWFRPYASVLGECERHLKGQIGNYRLALAERERAARAAALEAAKTNDAPALLSALGEAQEAAAKPAGKASIRFEWVVKRIIEDALPDEFWSPDREKIARAVEAQGYTGDEPPFVRGVVFERRVAVGARRS